METHSVHVCMYVYEKDILIQLVFVRLLGYGSVHIVSHIWDTSGGFCALLTWTCPLFSFLMSFFFLRVINAGKSTHNEDQASCEVLFVKKKTGAANSTPNKNSTKRRSSLPNGEGLQLKDNSVGSLPCLVSCALHNKYKRMWQYGTKRATPDFYWMFHIFPVIY